MHDRMEPYTYTSPELTGGDIDARWDQAAMVGVGLDYDDRVSLQTNDILDERDSARWELDPMSSEDYQER